MESMFKAPNPKRQTNVSRVTSDPPERLILELSCRLRMVLFMILSSISAGVFRPCVVRFEG